MAHPAWTPTQQVRALLLLHELAADLAVEARARTMHGCPQLAAQLAAVGKRSLPGALAEMADWSALRLAGGREALRSAIGQFTGSSAWAERVTADVVLMLRQGERFADAGHRLDDLSRAIAGNDEAQARRWFEHHLARLHQHRSAHAGEDAAAASEAWNPAVERLHKAADALGLRLMPPAPLLPGAGPTASPPTPDRTRASSSTPYQPSSATELGSDSGGSHALRRRRR